LDATERITVCSGIANMTARHPHAMANGARTLADAHGDRAVLGIGVAHQYTTALRGIDWTDPVGRMRAYLDEMGRAPTSSPEPERTSTPAPTTSVCKRLPATRRERRSTNSGSSHPCSPEADPARCRPGEGASNGLTAGSDPPRTPAARATVRAGIAVERRRGR